MPGMDRPASAMPEHSGTDSAMPGMDNDAPAGDGLAATVAGFRLAAAATALTAGQPGTIRFQILGPDGKPVTTFANDQTKPMHFYLIRTDLTGFQHLHPSMAGDGTWTAPVAAVQPGAYRMYGSFIAVAAGKNTPLVLGEQFTVAGAASRLALPSASDTAQVDGYTLTFAGHTMAGMAGDLTVSVARDGKPVNDLQPYLDTYAHLTAFHASDQAFANLHPQGQLSGDHGGPTLSFHTAFAKPGDWRLYVQFEAGGALHTAAVTLHVI